MSNWDSQNRFGDDTFMSQPPRRTSAWWWVALIVGGLFVSCIACSGFMFWQVVNVMSGNLRSELTSLPGTDEPSLRAKQAEVTAAFSSDKVGLGDAELRAVQRLLDNVVRATQDGDGMELARHVDAARLLQEMQAGGVMKRLGFVEAGIVKAQLPQSLNVPAYWKRYRVVHVKRGVNANEAVVYGYLWDTGEDCSEARVWIVRQGQGWKAYDWELLQYGIRLSTELALHYSYADDPGLDQYHRCLSDIRAADQFQSNYKYAMAEEILRAAADRRVLPQFHDDAALVVGYAWLRLGHAREALASFRRVQSPTAAPGAFYGQAQCHSRLGQHQQTLDFAARYEALVGSGPHLSQLKAEALTALKRNSEAAAEWRNVLKFDNNNYEALESLGLALADDEKDVLAEFVSRVDDPPATAQSLARSFASHGDTAALQAIVTLLVKIAPDSPRLDYAMGLVKEDEAEYEQAAALYHKAMMAATDEDQRATFLYSYLSAMVAAGNAVAGYEAAPDASAAFSYLAGGYEERESIIDRATLPELLEAHRKRQPDDPWIYFYSGLLLYENQEYEAAERELRLGLELASAADEGEESYVLDSLRYRLIMVLHELGRDEEAYETIEPPDETFRQLAELCRRSDHTEPLKQLVAAHRAASPDDPWLDLYEGLVHVQEQDYAEADRMFARGYAAATEDYMKSRYRNERISARIAAGKALSAYEDLEPATEVFATLAMRLSSDEQWSELESLLNLHRTRQPDDPQLVRWEAEVHWRHNDYLGVVDALYPWPEMKTDDVASWQFMQAKEHVLRSLLRVNRHDDALAFAQAMYEQSGDADMLVIVHAAQHDLEETLHWMDESIQPRFSLLSLFDDEDVGRILRSQVFLPLRQAHPPPLPLNAGDSDIVLLLRQPLQLDAAQLRSTISPLSPGEVTVADAPGYAGHRNLHGFVVRTASGTLCVTAGDDRYTENFAADEMQLSNAALRQAFEQHAAWLAVEPVAMSGENDEALATLARRVAAAMLDDNCLAVYLGGPNRLLVNSTATRDYLAAEQPAPGRPAPVGESAWLYYVEGDDTESSTALRDSRRRVKQLSAAFNERGEGQRVFVKATLKVGAIAEPHWLEVKKIERGRYGQQEIVAEFTTDSSLVPYFTAGEPVSVAQYQIDDWKITEGETPQ